MAWTLGFYKSADWPDETGAGTNGGAVDLGAGLVGAIHEIFDPAESSYLGGPDHTIYRKIFVRNEDGNNMQDAAAFLHNTKYPGMITVALEKSGSDTSADPTTIPGGYSAGDFVEADGQTGALAKSLGGADLAVSASLGVWLKLNVTAGLQEADGNVPINLVTIGTR